MPEPEEKPEFKLPSLPAPPPGELPLSQQTRISVHQIIVTGSTIFSDEELAAVTAPYTRRSLAAEELEQLRQRLTLMYVNEGYLNSGAVLPDQEIREGVVHYEIIEGRLAQIDVEGNRWFRERYLESRIARAAETPLDVTKLAEELEVLQQDQRIRHIEAELLPGDRPGEARLRTRFEEEPPLVGTLEYSNRDSPSVGEHRIQADLTHRNLSGWGDTLALMGAWNEGLWEGQVSYRVPITRWDTTVGGWYQAEASEVVEDPFDAIDIESRSRTIGVEITQPIYRTRRSRVGLGLTGELRQSRTYLLDQRFPFEQGSENGRVDVTVLRASQNWLYRDLQLVVAARSMFSLGVDAFDATTRGCTFDAVGICTTGDGHRRGVADAHFFAWLGQFQLVRRFDPWGVEALFRTDLQLADDPLFSLEQYSVGGYSTVRGYRENQLVRDNGLTSSLEVRIPVWVDAARKLTVQLAPFCDAGRSWNTDRDEPSPRTIASVGIGLRATWRHLSGELFWGHQIEDVFEPDDPSLQDEGVHFSLVASF